MSGFFKFLAILALLFSVSVNFADAAYAQSVPAAGTPPPAGSDWRSFFGLGDETPDAEKSLAEWQDVFALPSACWGCDLFQAMANVTLKLGEQGSSLFVDGARTALGAFMGIWLVFQLFKMVSVTHANSPVQGIDEIVNRLILMTLILFLLNAVPFTYIMEGLVFPIFGDVMGTASALVGGSGGSCGAGAGSETFITEGISLMCSMHIAMGKGLGIGAFLVANAETTLFKFEILRIVGGVIMFAAFGTMLIMLPFRLFDAMIRIATVSVILPAVCLAYLFKPSRGIVKQAVSSLLASLLTFLFTCIAIAIALGLINEIIKPLLEASNYESNSDDIGVGPIGGRDFMLLISASIGMAAMVLQAGSIASEFAGFQGSLGSAGAATGGAVGLAAGAGARYGGGALLGSSVKKGAAAAGGPAGVAAATAGGAAAKAIKPGSFGS